MKKLGPTLAAALLLLTVCEKFALDRQMEELCKKGGGVKVYETVTLPPEMFDQWGVRFLGGGDANRKIDWGRTIDMSWSDITLKRGILSKERED